ncbi:MAG: energy transducer TonB, partial [Candidatus Accumulibacter sp.]|nr:energy transducer TonB [Accumulibacter sp.]
MSALFVHPGLWRGGIFSFVACAHALFLTALSLAKAPEPPVDDKIIVVEMLPMALPPAPGPPEPAPRAAEPEQPVVQPVVEPPPPPPKPAPVKNRPVRPREVAPVVKAPPPPAIIEETVSNEPPSAGAATPTPLAEAPAVFGHGAPGNAPSESGPAKSGAAGGGDSQARFDADYLRNPKPPYPPLSRRMREEGRVVLRVLVTIDGGAGDVEVRNSSGSARLDESALRTIRRWKFIP